MLGHAPPTKKRLPRNCANTVDKSMDLGSSLEAGTLVRTSVSMGTTISIKMRFSPITPMKTYSELITI